jgi:dolichol-phosphate mannosyltransferase
MSTAALLIGRPRTQTVVRFGLVGLTGLAVNQFLFMSLTDGLAINFAIAAILATQVSTTWNFVGAEYWAFRGRAGRGPLWMRYGAYSAVNNATLILRIPLLGVLALIGLGYAWANLVTLIALFVVRFLISDGLIWSRATGPAADFADPTDPAFDGATAAETTGPGRYQYDVAGAVRLDSDVELPELAFFRTDQPVVPDIRIRIGMIGAMPAARIRMERDGERLTYREHLGAFGANFSVQMGQPIEVRATPLLALSRHVLYTNVIEALLRFVLVSRGYVLLHAACVAVEGRAALFSAQTDTGKTSTVIDLVRRRGYGFLSDDMTIIEPTGHAVHYPKPMTLSFHTMSAVRGDEFPARQRLQLQVQSRIHSKSGRTFGRTLGTLNVPIMSVNSVVQLVVPPPKYRIDDLLPCEIVKRLPIGDICLMERGEWLRERVEPADAVEQLLANTDDAYGFPPFDSFAPELRIDGLDYAALRRQETRLLDEAVSAARVWRLRVPGHEWSELLPEILERGDDGTTASRPDLVGVPVEPEPVAIPIGRVTPELAHFASAEDSGVSPAHG